MFEMDKSKLEYVEFYKAELGSGNYCTKSFGFAVWRHQQAKVEELQKRVDSLTQTMEELLEEMKYPTATFEEVIVCGVKELEQALKGEG